MFSVNFVTFDFCKLFFSHDSIENVADIDVFKVVPLPRLTSCQTKNNLITTPVLRVTS